MYNILYKIENSKKLRIINITQNKNDKYDIIKRNIKTIS